MLICVRGECAPSEKGFDLEKRLLALIEQHGLDNPEHPNYLKCTVTNCLGVCHDGPIMMVHPDGVRYKNIDQTDLERIFEAHFLQGRPVQDLIHDQTPQRAVTARRPRPR